MRPSCRHRSTSIPAAVSRAGLEQNRERGGTASQKTNRMRPEPPRRVRRVPVPEARQCLQSNVSELRGQKGTRKIWLVRVIQTVKSAHYLAANDGGLDRHHTNGWAPYTDPGSAILRRIPCGNRS